MRSLKVNKRIAMSVDEFARILGSGFKYQSRQHNKSPIVAVDVRDWGDGELNFHISCRNPEDDAVFGFNLLIPQASFDMEDE